MIASAQLHDSWSSLKLSTALLTNLLGPNFTLIVCEEDDISGKKLHTRKNFQGKPCNHLHESRRWTPFITKYPQSKFSTDTISVNSKIVCYCGVIVSSADFSDFKGEFGPKLLPCFYGKFCRQKNLWTKSLVQSFLVRFHVVIKLQGFEFSVSDVIPLVFFAFFFFFYEEKASCKVFWCF